MRYWFYTISCIGIYLYLGFGPSFFLLPRRLRGYLPFWAPFVGYCYLTLVGWFLYISDVGGTDLYSIYLLIPPGVLLFGAIRLTGVSQLGAWPWWRMELVWPLLIGLVAFGLVSAPFWNTIPEPTSLTIGNNDVAGSAGAATYLKEHSRSDQTGFLGQSNAFKGVVEMEIFGGPFASAFLSSLLGLETYQIQSLHINLFFLLAVLATYILARTAFGYRQPGAILATAAFAFNPIMVYVALHGFQGQMVGTGLAVCLICIWSKAMDECRDFSDWWSYLPLAILMNWGLSLTYPLMLPLLYAPLAAYLMTRAWHEESPRLFWQGAASIALSVAVGVGLSFFRAKALLIHFLGKGQVEAGWYIPWLFSPKVFGVVHPTYADLPYNGLILILLWAAAAFLVLMGWRKAFRQDRGIFYLSAISIGMILVGYGILSFGQRTPESWGGYRSFKFLSYFLPLLTASGLVLFRGLSFSKGLRVPLLFSCAMALGIGSSAYWGFLVSTSRYLKYVTREMVELKSVGDHPAIDSINIPGSNCWEIMWETNFLMRKKLHFETSGYTGWTASSLDGQWTLIRRDKTGQNLLVSSADSIPINSRYMLMRSMR